MTRKNWVLLIQSPTPLHCYMCFLFIGLNYPFYRVYNIVLQLLQYILGIFHCLSSVSGVILLHRPQVMGLHDWPAHRASRFGLGPLPLASDRLETPIFRSGLRPNGRRPCRSTRAVHECPHPVSCTWLGNAGGQLVLWWGDPRPAGRRRLRVDRAETT